MPDKSKMSRGALISYTYNSRGEAWRAAFHHARNDGADRYRAALIAESKHGSEFQRGVCASALARGIESYNPKPTGAHARTPIKCVECGIHFADPPSAICPGCEAYKSHTS